MAGIAIWIGSIYLIVCITCFTISSYHTAEMVDKIAKKMKLR